MVLKIKEGGTGQVTAPGARVALGLSDQDIIDIVTPLIGGPFQPLDSDLTAIAALTTTPYGIAFLTLANAAAARTYLSLGTMATETATNYLTTAAAASSYQPLDSDLTAIAALSTTSYGRSLLTLADAAAARTALALGTMATETASNYLTTATAAATYLTITSAGTTYLPLAGGTLTGLLTSNGQIAFPGTQNPSSNVNTLDDYEEGTWTPVYVASSGAFGATTYSNTNGYYTKIGRLVTIMGWIQTATFAIGTASGSIQLGGIPFTAATPGSGIVVGTLDIGFRASFVAGQNHPSGGSITSGLTIFSLHVASSSTASGGGFQSTAMDTVAGAKNVMRFSGQYFTD